MAEIPVRRSRRFERSADERGSHRTMPVPETSDELVVPLHEERVIVSTRATEGERVRVSKRVETRDELVETLVMHEDVGVERVAVDRPVDEAPPVRREGSTIIVPIVEEIVVVQKKLVLREEIRITKMVRREPRKSNVTLRREIAEISRADGKEVNK